MNVTWWLHHSEKTHDETTDVAGALEDVRCQMTWGGKPYVIQRGGWAGMIRIDVPCASAPGIEVVYIFGGERREMKKFTKQLRKNGWLKEAS